MEACGGSVRGAFERAFVNRTPRCASAWIAGVRAGETRSARSVSTVTSTTFIRPRTGRRGVVQKRQAATTSSTAASAPSQAGGNQRGGERDMATSGRVSVPRPYTRAAWSTRGQPAGYATPSPFRADTQPDAGRTGEERCTMILTAAGGRAAPSRTPQVILRPGRALALIALTPSGPELDLLLEK